MTRQTKIQEALMVMPPINQLSAIRNIKIGFKRN